MDGNSIPNEWWYREGRFLCTSCGRHYDNHKRSSHTHSCKGTKTVALLSPELLTPPNEVSTAPTPENTNFELPPLPSVCSLQLSTCKDVPYRCRQIWEEILSSAIRNAVSENSLQAWTLLAMLPKCVLPAPHRGGRKGHMAYASHAYKCMQRWAEQEYSDLWSEAIVACRKKQKSPTEFPDEDEKAAIRAELLVRHGELSRGLASLTSDPMAPDDDETFEKLLEKHPRRLQIDSCENCPPPNCAPLELDEREVAKTLKSFNRGSSAGTMGLRPEHLQAALLVHGNDFLRSLTKLTNHLLAGKAPSEVQAHFAGARLCALSKGENDVRPIAAGETLRRLASKAVCNAIRPKASELFEGKQYGVAATAGAERVIHMCRLAMSSNMENPNFVMCKVDLRNAFNNVSRAAFLPLVQEYFPELFPWINWCYSDPSSLTYGARFISSEEGVQQGDPLGPLLFSLVALELSEAINLQTDIPAQLWYLDDGVLVGQAQEVRDALDTIARVGPQWGLYLNTSKCEIITSPSSAHQADYFPDIPDEKINSQGNFDILGSPVGSADHCSAYLLSHALEPAEDTLDAITNIQDPQVALALIRQCAGFCQMVYAMRSTPPQSLIHLCSRLDDFLMTAIEAIICPLDRSAQSQAQRLKRHGGLGLRSAALHASAAYVASVAFASATDSWDPTDAEGFSEAILDINQKAGTALLDPRGRVLTTPNAPCEKALSAPYSYRKRRRPPPGNDPHPPDEPPGHILRTTSRTANTPTDAYPLSTPLYGSEECQDMLPPQWPKGKIPRQRVISYAIAAHAFSQEYETTDARTRARWISQCGTGASSWAFVTPSKDLGHAFTPTQFRTLARWWLGVDIYHEDSTCPMPKCSLPLDSKGDHALSCKHGHGIVTRHNAVTDQFADVCSRARLAPQREKSLGNRGPGGALTRPGDIYLPSLFLGNPIVLDFAVTHAQQLKYTDKVRNASWVAAGSFAEHYSSMEKGKQRREAVEAGCDFTAMVVESYGAWSPSASAVLRKVGERCSHASGGLLSEGEATSRIFAELNITLMRFQARMMVARSPSEDPIATLEE